jgi:hypothetical protein
VCIGYEWFAEVPNYPGSASRFFVKKRLKAAAQ